MSRWLSFFRALPVLLEGTPFRLSGGKVFDDWWNRVFGTNGTEPEPAALLEHLQRLGFEVTGRFRGDDQGWFSAEIVYDAGAEPLMIDRYLANEEGIRTELNACAAWLETLERTNEHAVRLMQHMISTTQLFMLRQQVGLASFVPGNELCRSVCQFLAQTTEGVYQLNGQGFFAADGTRLIHPEE
jgi:hypothetical protein